MQEGKKKRRWWHYLLLALAMLSIFEGTLFIAVCVNAQRLDAPVPADAIIVLGARIYEDGSPSPALERRLLRALELYEQGYAQVIITTGAQGDDEPMPEGDAMAAFLTAKGVPDSAVIAETNSYNTDENLANAQAIMEGAGLETAIIVSSDYHLWRALTMCKAIGLTATGAGSQNALTLPVAIRNCLQETISWIKYVTIG